MEKECYADYIVAKNMFLSNSLDACILILCNFQMFRKIQTWPFIQLQNPTESLIKLLQNWLKFMLTGVSRI